MNTKPVTMLTPDFPFPYDEYIQHPAGLGSVPEHTHGTEVAIVGAGMAGLVAALELMKMGLRPVIYESGTIGGRLRGATLPGTDGPVADMGGMRFPVSSRAFWHYADLAGVDTTQTSPVSTLRPSLTRWQKRRPVRWSIWVPSSSTQAPTTNSPPFSRRSQTLGSAVCKNVPSTRP